MADIIKKGLFKLGPDIIDRTERTHRLLPTKNHPGKDGRVAITAEDLRYHYDFLLPIMTELAGVQPSAAAYTTAIHALDKVPR
jgi:hypothetical protein